MKLYLIGTPIGRIDDISEHALDVLGSIEYLAVEDTRRTSGLLQLLAERYPQRRQQLESKRFIRSHRENERQALSQIIDLLESGREVGLLSDAGMPAISDPGAYIVDGVRRAGYQLEIVSGPSALTTALSLSGFEANSTLFVGFIPKKINSFLDFLHQVATNSYGKSMNVVFFESPFRVGKTAQVLLERFPQARLFLARELTKKYQELLWIDSASLPQISLNTKGEYTGVLNLKML